MDAETFCECITDESYVWTDGLRSYVKPLKENNCSNKVLESYQEYDAVNHLNKWEENRNRAIAKAISALAIKSGDDKSVDNKIDLHLWKNQQRNLHTFLDKPKSPADMKQREQAKLPLNSFPDIK